MRFEPRQAGCSQLFLHISKNQNVPHHQQALLARLKGPPTEDRLDTMLAQRREGSIEQAGYQVEFLLWFKIDRQAGVLEQDQSVGAIQTPSFPHTLEPTIIKPWVEISYDAVVMDEFSFIIREIGYPEPETVGFQLLSDGSVIVLANGSPALAEPILVNPQTYRGVGI